MEPDEMISLRLMKKWFSRKFFGSGPKKPRHPGDFGHVRHPWTTGNRGLTLIEVSMTVLLAGVLVTGGYALSRAQNRGLVVARSNNLSLWILEGTRNRILTEMVPFGAIDERRLKALIAEVRLPPGMKLKAEKAIQIEGPRRILMLSLIDENQSGMGVSRALTREIELNE